MRLIAIFTACLVGAAAVSAYEVDPNGTFANRVVTVEGVVPAPETVIDMAGGERTSIDAHPGKVRLVTMWATWCHVCEYEMPELAKLAAAYQGTDLMVMPVSVDEPPALGKIEKHLERHDLTIFPVMHDRNWALAGRVGLVGTPTTIIVDKFDQVVAAFQGQAPWGDPDTRAYLDALLAAPDAEVSRALLGQ